MKVLVTILFFFSVAALSAQSDWKILDSHKLTTLAGKRFNTKSLKSPYTVFIFFSPDCPLSQQYTLPLKLIANRYKDKLNFIGVFPGKRYKDSDYQNFKKIYELSYELIKDEKLKLTNSLEASVTPEVFLVDRNLQILYHGAIDNWAVKLGSNRKNADEHYLSEAISQTLKKQVVNPNFVKPIGCFIEK